jgi:hypothetical protein
MWDAWWKEKRLLKSDVSALKAFYYAIVIVASGVSVAASLQVAGVRADATVAIGGLIIVCLAFFEYR